MTRSSTSRVASPWALLLAVALFAPTPGCNSAEWHAEVYDHLTYQDVFQLAYYQIGSDYPIALADPEEGLIESHWTYDTFAPVTRLPARERVVAEVRPVDDGVELKVRVNRQARDERVGYSAYDEEADDWEDIDDDVERAAVVFQKIRTSLVRGRPSDEFLLGTPLPPGVDD